MVDSLNTLQSFHFLVGKNTKLGTFNFDEDSQNQKHYPVEQKWKTENKSP
jgi:hypothetical protein